MVHGKKSRQSGRLPITTPGRGSSPPIFKGSTLLEHSTVELRNNWAGWPKGARGTVVSEHPTCALVEFSDHDGEAIGFAEIPYGALRALDGDSGQIGEADASSPSRRIAH